MSSVRKLRTEAANNPAPTSSTSDTATCAISSHELGPLSRSRPSVRLARSTLAGGTRCAASAGATPLSIAVSPLKAVANTSTRGSMRRSSDNPIDSSLSDTGAAAINDDSTLRRPRGDRQSGQPAAPGDQRALGQHLPRDASAAGAHRQPHGQLALPGGRSRHQQVRQVGARHDQEERHTRHQDQQRLTKGIALRRHAAGRIDELDGDPGASPPHRS